MQEQVERNQVLGIAEPLYMALKYSEMLLQASLQHFEYGLETSSAHGTVPANDALIEAKQGEPPVPNAVVCPGVRDISGLIRRATARSTPPDVRLQAAVDISMILSTHQGDEIDTELLIAIERIGSSVISTLSTAAVALLDSDDGEVVRSLSRLATSPHFARKMVKRCCTLLALMKHLSHHNLTTREAVLLACNQLLVAKECQLSLSHGTIENVDILREGLVEAARNETNPKFQLLIVSALHRLVQIVDSAFSDVLDVFQSYAYKGASDAVAIEAAVNLSGQIKVQRDGYHEYLWTVTDFSTFPFPEVRREALKALEAATSSPDDIMQLLTNTEFVENANLVIQHGSKDDCAGVLNVIRQIARSSLYHEYLFVDPDLLSSIVQMGVGEHSRDQAPCSKDYATEILLSLLCNEENLHSFLQFDQLLPWLSNVAESVALDGTSKHMKGLVSKLTGSMGVSQSVD